MSAKEKKVYDYAPERVREKLLDAFRKGKGEATSADLVALTGLPKTQVEAEVKAVSDEYGARLRVTESGEILYSFPRGMKSRYHGLLPSLKRFWKALKKGAAAVASFLFKIWIVVMLVGYFVLFVALAVLALVASIALSASGNSRDDKGGGRRDGGGLGGLWLTGRLFDAIINLWFYSELFKSPQERARRSESKRQRRPLHKAIFSFVFGDGDPDADWDEIEKKAVIAFLRANRGIITLPEFMAISGLSPVQAEERINRYLYEFEGSPEATEGGAVVFSFPGLLRGEGALKGAGVGAALPMRSIAAFSANPAKSNRLFCALNAVNLVFGSYFLFESATLSTMLPVLVVKAGRMGFVSRGFETFYTFVYQLLAGFGGIADPTVLLGIVLGAIPLSFSLIFYAVPAIRSRRLAARNERARFENLRRVAYRSALSSPRSVRPEAIPSSDAAARPRDGGAPERVLKELAAWSGAEPRADGSYDFAELERITAEAAKARAAVDPRAFELGGTVFDSHS